LGVGIGQEFMLMKHLSWKGPLLDVSGYAAAGRGYIRACEYGDIIVQAQDRSRSINLKDKGIDERIFSIYRKLENNKIPDDSPCVQHQVPDCFYINKKSKYSIGFTIFEMNSVPSRWVPYCNLMDVIWTGSHFSKAAFMTSNVKTKIEVVPHALDLDIYNPEAKPWIIKNKRAFCFLSVFDFTERKDWKTLLRAYWNTFSKKDDVCLILKVFFGGFGDHFVKDIYDRISSYRMECGAENGGTILVYGHDILDKDMPGLYRACDCYVGTSREGFGLTYCEAMACGLPCIGPQVGGTREFMSEENSFLVHYQGDDTIGLETLGMYPDFAGIKWPTHSCEHLSFLMRQVYGNTEERTKKAQKGLKDVSEMLSYKSIGRKMQELLP